MITEQQIKYIASKGNSGDNTRFLIDFLESACESRGIEKNWSNIRALMLTYKPEAITRKRREFVASTKAQREEEERYHLNYFKNNPAYG